MAQVEGPNGNALEAVREGREIQMVLQKGREKRRGGKRECEKIGLFRGERCDCNPEVL